MVATSAFGGARAHPAHADWLVTTEGERVETRGAWNVRGRMVVFTTKRGTLASMRLDEVDLDASETATEAAIGLQSAPPPPPKLPELRPPVLTLTDADISRGTGNATGMDALIARLRVAHENQDLDDAMRLVHWSGVSRDVRTAIGESFAFLFARPIQSIELVTVAGDDTAAREKDGVSYRPNLTVTGKLVITLELIEDDADADRAEVTFLVGEVLGTPRIAAAAADG